VREAQAGAPPWDEQALARRLKALPLRLTGLAPIARAISSAGGVAWDEIDESFMLRRLPGIFVAGEMIDWEAPTGGYLLQACLATGLAAGRGAARRWQTRIERVRA
jgi:predicted flavoprotein YhiN